MSCSICFDDVCCADVGTKVLEYLDVSLDVDSPDSPVGIEGNTNSNSDSKKQDSGAVCWIFTWNNYPEDYKKFLSPKNIEDCKVLTYGREIGEEKGTPHLQGYIRFKPYKKKRLTWLKKIHPSISWKKKSKKSTHQQAIEYCWKDDNNPYVFGIARPPRCLKKSNMYPWQRNLADFVELRDEMWDVKKSWVEMHGMYAKNETNLFKTYRPDRSIIWIYEEDGGTGKSQMAKYLALKEDALVVGGKSADMKFMINKRVEAGRAPDLIIMDLAKATKKVDYKGIEEIKNGLFASTKYECNMVIINEPMIIIFANFKPNANKMTSTKDKLVVFGINKEMELVADCDWNMMTWDTVEVHGNVFTG